MPALPGPPPRASTPSMRRGAGNAPRKARMRGARWKEIFAIFPRLDSWVPQQSWGNAPLGKSHTSRPRSITMLVGGLATKASKVRSRRVNLPAKD